MKTLLDILTALSSIGTFGAFVMLFRRDKDKQKQIDYLAGMVVLKEKQLNLSVLPEIHKTGTSSNPGTGELAITIENRGETARIIDIISESEDVTVHSKSVPYSLEKLNDRFLFFRSNGKNTNMCNVVIIMIFEDKLKNKFSMKFDGIGSTITAHEPIMIN